MSVRIQSPHIDFIFVGVPRSATTWIYKCLQEHPEVCVSEKKEFIPFDDKGRLRESALREQFKGNKTLSRKNIIFPIALYARLDSPSLIKEYFPEAEVFFCLRNPVERAYSHFLYNKARGILRDETLIESFEHKRNFLQFGFYAEAITRYRNILGKEKVNILFYKDIIDDPYLFMKDLCDSIGVSPDVQLPYTNSYVNVSRPRLYHSYLIIYMLRYISVFLKKLKKYSIGRKVVSFSKKIGLEKIPVFLERFNQSKTYHFGKQQKKIIRTEAIDSRTRKILREFYRKDIECVRNITHRDLAHWY